MTRPSAGSLIHWADGLLQASGLAPALALDVAQVLVEADLLGHDTHGLALLPGYLAEIDAGSMGAQGEPTVLSERTVSALWDGRRLPGPALVRRAIAWAQPRAREHGSATVVIRRSHHIACLAAYLEPVARQGLMIELFSSDPAVASVAPFGGIRPVFTPNPLAVGIPGGTDPILVDISASVTTNGMSNRLKAQGAFGEHDWWLDAQGRPTRDPSVITATPPGSILPLGGLEAGHKGYGLALGIEALTAGLAGFGRADAVTGWGATVCVRLTDPQAFAGHEAFVRQVDWLIDACHGAGARDPARPVRLPGERGLARKREQLRDGVELHPSILPSLQHWAQRFGLPPPADAS